MCRVKHPMPIVIPYEVLDEEFQENHLANELADAFNANFAQFADNANEEILNAEPKATARN